MNKKEIDINDALACVKGGGTLVYPTDTIWGIGCDATNFEAVENILKLKGREAGKGFVVLMNSTEMVEYYTGALSPNVINYLLAERSTTIVFENSNGIAKNVLAEDGTLAIRIPQKEIPLSLISKLGFPIVSTSANLSGDPFPQTFDQINTEVLSGADYVLNLRSDGQGRSQPSRIVKVLKTNEIVVLRD